MKGVRKETRYNVRKETAFERWYNANEEKLLQMYAEENPEIMRVKDDYISAMDSGTLMEWAERIYNVRKKITKFEASGTYLQGYLTTSYSNLVKILGPPEDIMDEKVQVEWAFKYRGVPITIYSWMIAGPVNRNRNWHIGGYDQRAVTMVKKIFPRSKVRRY